MPVLQGMNNRRKPFMMEAIRGSTDTSRRNDFERLSLPDGFKALNAAPTLESLGAANLAIDCG
jgi:hypothetical protein